MKSKATPPRRPAVLLLVGIALIAAGIIFLKTQTPTAPAASEPAPQPAARVQTVAVPDTTAAADVPAPAEERVDGSVSDSISIDRRPPQEAGAEDGYWNGYHDGIAGVQPQQLDVTSNFPTAAAREAYAEGYREGYEQGFAEGSSQHR